MFKKHGLKLTTQRLAKYETLLKRKDNPTTENIYKSLINDYPTISLGTVYSTLHLFKDLGLIQELNFSDGNIRYDPNTKVHINLVCSKCGDITDYNNEKVKEVWQQIISGLKIKPKGQRIDLYYECEKCKRD
ncbi:MAG: transcriptional repressor [Candidatus Lokiarchaeota archaeon]|nr:transcriptional repressor [Candidatus Lokiarchaeota archaeon]